MAARQKPRALRPCSARRTRQDSTYSLARTRCARRWTQPLQPNDSDKSTRQRWLYSCASASDHRVGRWRRPSDSVSGTEKPCAINTARRRFVAHVGKAVFTPLKWTRRVRRRACEWPTVSSAARSGRSSAKATLAVRKPSLRSAIVGRPVEAHAVKGLRRRELDHAVGDLDFAAGALADGFRGRRRFPAAGCSGRR